MFMSYDVYFANWKRTKICALLMKIIFLLIGAQSALEQVAKRIANVLCFQTAFWPAISAASVLASSGDF